MTNTDSVGPEPKAERESQPTSMLWPEICNWPTEFWLVTERDPNSEHFGRSIRYPANQIGPDGSPYPDQQLCRVILGRNAEGTARRAVSPQLPNQEVAPQRGEVGEGVRLWGTTLEWLNNCAKGDYHDDGGLAAREILAAFPALSRPPVVRAMTAKENDLIEWMLKINEFNGAPIMWLSRLEHLASEVAAERALAVPPESEAG